MRDDLAIGHVIRAYLPDPHGRQNAKERPVFIQGTVPGKRSYRVLGITTRLEPWNDAYVLIPSNPVSSLINQPSAVHCLWTGEIPFSHVADDEHAERLEPANWLQVMKKVRELRSSQ